MPLKAKHIVEEVNGIRCTIVEKGISASRCEFLKNLLEFNKFEVVVSEESKESEEMPTTFTLGVTDFLFNPVIAVYESSLLAPKGGRVSSDYWDQKSTETIDQYWLSPEETQPGGSAWFYPRET
jgi:hypothetical protein